ncbi:MAG: hypothetical protein JXA33_10905 [Anaerolineae bacterium]|nr:hypothetical protein [Anaerolineae bacterium]
MNEQKQTSPVEQINAWVAQNAKRIFWVALVLAVPYLVLCNALAIFVVSALLSGGNCGR